MSHAILIDKHLQRCYKRCMHSEDGVAFHISAFLSIPLVESKTERTESHISALLFHFPFRYLIQFNLFILLCILFHENLIFLKYKGSIKILAVAVIHL